MICMIKIKALQLSLWTRFNQQPSTIVEEFYLKLFDNNNDDDDLILWV